VIHNIRATSSCADPTGGCSSRARGQSLGAALTRRIQRTIRGRQPTEHSARTARSSPSAVPSVAVDDRIRFWATRHAGTDDSELKELPPDTTVRTWRDAHPVPVPAIPGAATASGAAASEVTVRKRGACASSAVSAVRSRTASTVPRARKLHKRLHTHRTLLPLQTSLIAKPLPCGAFAEPSDGLEPSTPSLPCAPELLPWAAIGCRSTCLSRFRAGRACDWLPLVASAGLHKAQSRVRVRVHLGKPVRSVGERAMPIPDEEEQDGSVLIVCPYR
jgi:hypothetical protein